MVNYLGLIDKKLKITKIEIYLDSQRFSETTVLVPRDVSLTTGLVPRDDSLTTGLVPRDVSLTTGLVPRDDSLEGAVIFDFINNSMQSPRQHRILAA